MDSVKYLAALPMRLRVMNERFTKYTPKYMQHLHII